MTFGPIKTRKYEEMTPTQAVPAVVFRSESSIPAVSEKTPSRTKTPEPTTTRTERRPAHRKRTSQPRRHSSDQPRTGLDQLHPHDSDDHRHSRRRRTKTFARQTRRSLATAAAPSRSRRPAVSAPPAAVLQPQNTPPPPRLGENAARRTISRPDPVAIAVSLYGLTRTTKSLYTTRPVLSSSTRVSVLSATARRRDAALRPRPRRTGRSRRHRRTAFYTTTDLPLFPAVPPLTSQAPPGPATWIGASLRERKPDYTCGYDA